VRHYGEAVWLGGRSYGYPFGLIGVPRFAFSAVASRTAALLRRPPRTAADWLRSTFGAALADEVAIPLIEGWSGAPASSLSPATCDKISRGVAHTVLLKLAARATRRAVAIGYSDDLPESPNVWHVYPEGGISLLCRHLADEVGDVVRLESPVEAILVDSGRVAAVRVHGREHEVSAVISTAPYSALAKLVRGTDALSGLARFRYRPMIFVNMRFRGRGLLPDTVLWTPEPRFPFFRLTETTLSMPWLAPPGKSLITVDLGAQVGDETWRMDDEQLGEYCLRHIEPVIPDARRRFLGCRSLRTPIAYPIFLNEYEEERRRMQTSSGIEGLYSVGRNGEFAHILMEDVYWRTLRRVRPLLAAA
jgi:protoporphyrinogen oxidase